MKASIFFKWAAFTAVMLAVRVYLSHNYGFLFLIWNLFLAALPVYFAERAKLTNSSTRQLVWLCLTLLFLPNAPYLITDLFHLHSIQNIPQWLDLVLLFNFSMLGIFLFVTAWQTMYHVLERFISSKLILISLKISQLLMCGYGIYLGRYLRFNSWDVLTQPMVLIKKMYGSIFWPNHAKETIAISVSFGVLLYLVLELFERQQPIHLAKRHELFKEKKSSF
jgi:uncharacterized membrane protein